MRNNQKVDYVIYNWYYSHENGEDYQVAQVGISGVRKIIYHKPSNSCDVEFCDIYFEDNRIKRIRNINEISYIEQEKHRL